MLPGHRWHCSGRHAYGAERAGPVCVVHRCTEQCVWCRVLGTATHDPGCVEQCVGAVCAVQPCMEQCSRYSRAWSSCPWCSVRSCSRASSYLQSSVAIHTICIDVGVTQL